jgi:SAM-dependent methyltransferase
MTYSRPNTSAEAEFDRYSNSYTKHVDKALPPWAGGVEKFVRIKVWHLLREVARRGLIAASADLLDAGCGVGLADACLRPHFRSVTGLDVSSASLELAEARNPGVRYVHYDGGEFPFDGESFDVVLVTCVLHHIPPAGRPAFFSNVRRVLKPGGVLLIYEHNPRNPLTRGVVSRCELDRDAVLLGAEECFATARTAGFVEPDTRYLTFLPTSLPAWLQVEETLFARVPMGTQYQFSAKREAA